MTAEIIFKCYSRIQRIYNFENYIGYSISISQRKENIFSGRVDDARETTWNFVSMNLNLESVPSLLFY